MSKLFNGLPPEFEQYNPENLITKFDLDNRYSPGYTSTFDNNGLFHSYDDLPSEVYNTYSGSGTTYTFHWHQHGVLARSGNRPVRVEISESKYSTLDSNNELHSYNGQPAFMNFSVTETAGSVLLKWAEHGCLGKDKDEPSVIKTWNGFHRKYFHKNNEFHRDNNPALIEENKSLWIVASALHNENGPAKVERFRGDSSFSSSWYLYGVHLERPVFNAIKAYQASNNIPLWVAFLCVVGLIDAETLSYFTDTSGKWATRLPTKWIWQALNITEQTWDAFASKVYAEDGSKFHNHDTRLEFEPARFLRFVAIVEHEEALGYELKVN